MASSTMMSTPIPHSLPCSFLYMTLPLDDIKKRSDVAQRSPYRVADKLDLHIEFELSRLIEKYPYLVIMFQGDSFPFEGRGTEEGA
jgi:hypothetical protein